MASFGTFKINDDWEAEVLLFWDCCYVLGNNTLLPTRQRESWCRNCRNVVAAEYIPTIAEIEEEIRQFSDPSDKIHKCFGRPTIEKILQDNRVRLEWLKTRKSLAHCFDCGKSEVIHIDADDFFDKISRTRIQRVSGGHASMAHEIMRRLTPEGILIETDDPNHAIGGVDA